MKKIPLLSLILLSVLSACSTGKTTAGTPAVKQAVWSDGTWLRDMQGRVIIVHGVNVSDAARYPPYQPFTTTSMPATETASVFDNIARAGFNGVRLIVEWAAIEPTPDTYDAAYLDRVQQEVTDCASAGLWVLLDMHQDYFSGCFCPGGDSTNGAPSWACNLAGYRYDPAVCANLSYLEIPQVAQSFQDFWDDKPGPDNEGLQEHFIHAFQLLAARFTRTANLLGYEIMNEPFAGKYPLFTTEFEQQALAPFYAKVTEGIRDVDPAHIVAFEPSLTPSSLNEYATGLSLTTFPEKFGNLLFVPHFYPFNVNSGAGTQTTTIIPSFDTIRSISAAMHIPWLIGESGVEYNSPGSAGFMVTLLNAFDRYNEGWINWSYNTAWDTSMSPVYPDGTQRMLVDQNGTPVFYGMDVLSRPYPMLTAGTPVSVSYPITTDPASFTTTTFTYTYKEDGVGHGPTELFIPRIHFPNGFTVTTTDGAASFDAASDVLSYTRGTRDTHTITVTPCKSGTQDCIGF